MILVDTESSRIRGPLGPSRKVRQIHFLMAMDSRSAAGGAHAREVSRLLVLQVRPGGVAHAGPGCVLRGEGPQGAGDPRSVHRRLRGCPSAAADAIRVRIDVISVIGNFLPGVSWFAPTVTPKNAQMQVVDYSCLMPGRGPHWDANRSRRPRRVG